MPSTQKLQQILAFTRRTLAGWVLCGLCLMSSGLTAQQISVVGSFPRDGARDLLRNLFISVKLDFPEAGLAIDPYTFTPENVRLHPSSNPLTPIDCWLYYSDEIKNISLRPKEILPANTTFVFEITSGLQDMRGIPVKPYRCTFSTGTQGLDRPITVPPGYGSEAREFAFGPGEGVDEPPPADFSEEIVEIDKTIPGDEAAEPDDDFLIDITHLLEEELLAEELALDLPDEKAPEMGELEKEWEDFDEDLYGEELLSDLPDIPEIVVSAPVDPAGAEESLEESMMDTPDLFSIPDDQPQSQPQPLYGYVPLAMDSLRTPRRLAPDAEAEEIRSTTFLDFTALFMEEGFVELRWEMASEFDNRYFSLERSTDGTHFTRIDTLNSLAEGGKKLALRYLRNDTQAPPGTHFYRIAYHTRSGEKGYSDIREVFVREKEHVRFVQFAVFPNGKLPIEFKLNERRPVTVWILDKKGAVVKKVSGAFGPGLVQKAVDMTGLPSGSYLGRIDARTVRTQREVVVLRP